MKKIFVCLFVSMFLAVSAFLIYTTKQIFKPETQAQKQAKVAYMAYYKAHSKAIGTSFSVDSVAYICNNFRFVPKNDTMVVIVDLGITNQTSRSKLLKDSSFVIIGCEEKMYLPTQTPFTIFENHLQPLKLIYYLPRNIIPTMYCELHIKSSTDSTQNAFVVFAKSYKEGG